MAWAFSAGEPGFIFTIILCEICLVNFFEVVKVVRTFGIDAFMDNEVFPVLFGNQGVAAMRTSQLYGREPAFQQRHARPRAQLHALARRQRHLARPRVRGRDRLVYVFLCGLNDALGPVVRIPTITL